MPCIFYEQKECGKETYKKLKNACADCALSFDLDSFFLNKSMNRQVFFLDQSMQMKKVSLFYSLILP